MSVADVVTLGFRPGTGHTVATLGFGTYAPPVVPPFPPGVSDVVTMGFLPGTGTTVTTIGFGVHVVAAAKVPEPFYARVVSLSPDRRFARVFALGPDPSRARWSRPL